MIDATRSALLLRHVRQLAHIRKRFGQAFRYLDGLVADAEREASAPWPGKVACPDCGAPVAGLRAEQRQQGHAVVRQHADGKRCE
jgi:hypothetical protein